MKLLLLMGLLATSASALADEYVNGYYRQNGTYVPPHYRSSPDTTPLNNWSTQGNVNPHTGEWGTRNPYAIQPIQPIQPPEPRYAPRYRNGW